ncbi:MAG: aspartate 1-decarboxylase [Chitinivibrionales bacterium]|nr:aspartate 1-decarboxylase [Chitinivibrionales bacterium]MBD3357121.1 aspartate 1-decarboxylase [Chitinivibrionales bacterium]
MLRRFLNAKIRDIRVTGTYLEYEGSITLDPVVLEKAGILPDEEVQIVNLENGARFTTYVIEGERGSGVVELNGPAARLALIGDRIMVLAYALLSKEEIEQHQATIVSGDQT